MYTGVSLKYRFDTQLDELYTLLYENYVEDDDNMFRFDYSRDFLKWYVGLCVLCGASSDVWAGLGVFGVCVYCEE